MNILQASEPVVSEKRINYQTATFITSAP
ncbi:MAG TPA: YihA family ribosome biogenesis GTP-binding protein, partial [Idiomarina baltica]|nr:YihA family ribosome biogenesis GTP-binding protein [Idiomarina baltica]